MEIVLLYILGLVSGFILTNLLQSRKKSEGSVGTLRIDETDPDGAYIFLELRKGIPYVEEMRTVQLDVKVRRSQD